MSTELAIDYLRMKAPSLHEAMAEHCERLATVIELGTISEYPTVADYLEADAARLTGLMHSAILNEIPFPEGLTVTGVSDALTVIYTASRISSLAKAA